ncbi:hypothetical protein VTN02DRAFT_803 [Thermoascus thermophilus]
MQMDQVSALEAIGVAVATINSTTPLSERRAILEDLLSGHPRTRLLYVTPELCQTETFRRNLQTIHAQGELNRIAIDEAHCISEWGHDFRPAYKELSWFKRALKTVPISALTATATPQVRADIINLLGLDPATLKTFNTPSARPNIHYEVRYLTDYVDDPTVPGQAQIDDVVSWLKSIQSRREARLARTTGIRTNSDPPSIPPMSGIIYVPLRSVCESLANSLTASDESICAVAYHAGLQAADRSRIQAMWTSAKPCPADDRPPPAFFIIVATNAFGMGIDNPHVRFVVHWTPPRSFEGFVQESGRAGRDGRAAVSLVYYNTLERDRVLDRIQRDVARFAAQTSKNGAAAASKLRSGQARLESFQKVVTYCETTTRCRHEMITEYFGDLELEQMGSVSSQRPPRPPDATRTSPCDFACDFCKEGPRALAQRKARMEADSIVQVQSMDVMYPSAFAPTSFTAMVQLATAVGVPYHQHP